MYCHRCMKNIGHMEEFKWRRTDPFYAAPICLECDKNTISCWPKYQKIEIDSDEIK